jgi:DeoR/GlpR family transcriptional regulator of sugar metabolism
VAREVNVVADSSKFARRSLSLIARLESVHRIITDDKIDADTAATIRGRGIELVVV